MNKRTLILLMHKIALKYITSSYITDFLIHDIKAIYEDGEGDAECSFIWQVRNTGTWLHRFCGDDWESRTLVYLNNYPENTQHYFHYNRKRIRRITLKKALEIVNNSLTNQTSAHA